MEAQSSFPGNVEARTIHSLAFRAVGMGERAWQAKLSKHMTIRDYAALLKLDFHSQLSMKSLFCIKEALREFQNSQDSEPSSKHIPAWEFKTMKSEGEKEFTRQFVDDFAPLLWQRMIDPTDDRVGITHDTYLKLWQLTDPVLSTFDLILLDEAQDSNPVTMAILKQQKVRLIVVGDSWQQIYSFRGAVNAMELLSTPLDCVLTQSFRFGKAIADLANKILRLRDARNLLRGLPRHKSFLCKIPSGEPYTMIFRYNIELLEEASALAARQMYIYVVGSLDKTTGLMLDVFHLYNHERAAIRDPRVKVFKTWAELEMNYDILDDIELKKSFRFVERYGQDIPAIIKMVQKVCVPNEEQSDVVLTTGHQSKGREWQNVRIAGDFFDSLRSQAPEELNLLYVAITRTISQLEVPPFILEWLLTSAKAREVRSSEGTASAPSLQT